MELDIQAVYIIIVIPLFLAIVMVMEGIKNLLEAKSILPPYKEGLDDDSFLAGRQTGCLGFSYLILGLFFLGVIGLVYLFLSK